MMIVTVVVDFQIMWFPLALRHSLKFSMCVFYLPCGKACIMEREDSFIVTKNLFLGLSLFGKKDEKKTPDSALYSDICADL